MLLKKLPPMPGEPSEDLNEYIPVVKRIAGKMHRRTNGVVPLEEMFSDGCLGLVQAKADWEGKGPFLPWAVKKIRYEIIDGIHRWNMVTNWGRRKGDYVYVDSLDEPVSDASEDVGFTMVDNLSAPPEDPVRVILYQEVMNVVRKLDPVDQNRVQYALQDYNKADVKAMKIDIKAKARRAREQWVTIRRIRTALGE